MGWRGQGRRRARLGGLGWLLGFGGNGVFRGRERGKYGWFRHGGAEPNTLRKRLTLDG